MAGPEGRINRMPIDPPKQPVFLGPKAGCLRSSKLANLCNDPRGLEMKPLSSRARFRWNLVAFLVFTFLTVAEIFALLHSPPMWVSNWPHWNWQDWTSLSSDLFFPVMALACFVDLRKDKRSQG